MTANAAKADTETVALEYDLPYPPAKVWRALTEPQLVARWLMANDIDAKVGHNFKFTSTPMPQWDGIVRCEVLEVELHRRLRYAWKSAPDLDTVVTWTLTPTASGGTKLALEHTGFRPTNAFAASGARQGWQYMVSDKLPAVLATVTS